MISPLVMLKSRSWVMGGGWRGACLACAPPRRKRPSRRPLQRAAGLAHRRRGLVARDDLVDAEQVLRIVLAARDRLADESRGHQLMVAGAVIALVGLQLDLGRQLEIAERVGELDRVNGLLAVGDEREGHCRGVAEPMPGG